MIKVNDRNTVTRSQKCSKLIIQRPKRGQLVSLFLTLSLTFRYSSAFIVNFQHISHLVRRKNCQNTYFILEKRDKSKFNRFQIDVFFLPSISLLEYKPPTRTKTHQIFPLSVYPYTYVQDVLTGFYGIPISFWVSKLLRKKTNITHS